MIQHASISASRTAERKNKSFFGAITQRSRLTSLFGAFVFLQFAVLALANHAGEGYLTPVQRDRVYYALQVFVIFGYLFYAVFFRYCAVKRIRRVIASGVFGLLFICVTIMLGAGTGSLLNVTVSMAAVFCIGGIGGAVHHRMSMETAAGTDAARFMGIGSAAAVLLQYLLQVRQGVTVLLPVFMAGAFLLSAFLLQQPFSEEHSYAGVQHGKMASCRIVFSILIASVFILFTCFYNEMIHHLMIRSNYASANVYSWPRLMMIPGYLLFAAIGDRQKGKYVPMLALCIMLIALLNVVLVGDQTAWWFNMCLFYFSIAAFTSYYLLTFWWLAPDTNHPALWAPMGRMLDSAMVILTGAIRLSTLPATVVLGLDIVGVALVILLMAAGGDFNLFTEPQAASSCLQVTNEAEQTTAAVPERISLLNPVETLNKIRGDYVLTPRETAVLRELVLTEDTQAAIADRLHIQVKTLQTYVTRLYRKTGASTRAGLTDLYHECRNGRVNPD